MYAGHELTWRQAAGAGLANWYLWALLTPAIAWFARRFPLTRARWPVSLAVHVPAGIVCGALKVTADAKTAAFFTGARRPDSVMPAYVALLTYWVIVGAVHSLDHYRKYRERELQAAQLKTALARAQVQSLRMQIHPHFLFNTLNAIAEWCREDGLVAERAILALSSMLHAIMTAIRTTHWPVAREIELVDALFRMHLIRDPGLFVYARDVQAGVEDSDVPPMILLPIAENAMTHGPGAGHRGGVELSVRADATTLVIELVNPGAYRGPRDGGSGLPMVEKRLRLAYGDRASFAIGADGADPDRTRVTMRVPRTLEARP
jgi:hypothetical protein